MLARLTPALHLFAHCYVAYNCWLFFSAAKSGTAGVLAALVYLFSAQSMAQRRRHGTTAEEHSTGIAFWLLFGLVEAFSAWMVVSQNERALITLFKENLTPNQIFVGLTAAFILMEFVLNSIPHNPSATTRVLLQQSEVIDTKRIHVLPFSVPEFSATVEIRIEIDGGSGHDVDAAIIDDCGDVVVMLGRPSKHCNRTLILPSGTYALAMGNQFSTWSKKKVKATITSRVEPPQKELLLLGSGH